MPDETPDALTVVLDLEALTYTWDMLAGWWQVEPPEPGTEEEVRHRVMVALGRTIARGESLLRGGEGGTWRTT